VAYGLMLLRVIILAVRATKVDPIDPIITIMRQLKEKGEHNYDHDYIFRCSLCDSWVGQQTKHCG
jgi:hypothetical protein